MEYEDWLADYRIRRETVRSEVMAIGQEMLEIDRRAGMQGKRCTKEARSYARECRPNLEHGFCLVLWSRGLDERLFRAVTEGEDLDPDDARGLLAHKASNFHPRIARLTVHLDLAGLYAMVIWPEGRETPPPEPVVLVPPDELDLWFYFFTVAIELAQAIVIEGNYGTGLKNEMEYIEEVGLGGRVLFYDNSNELYRMADESRWPLERVGDAVAFAAAQQIVQ